MIMHHKHKAERAAKVPFKRLFLGALAAAGVLAAACGWLSLQQQSVLDREGELDRQVALLEQELAGWQSDFLRQQKELDEAEKTIDLLAEYSIAAPSGEVPEYATLFPDFYAPPFEGQAVPGGKVCCLTFDDGPSANTDRVLEILDRYGVKATFFVVGRTGEADQERMRQIVAAGHTIAMHSWSHDYTKVYASVEDFLAEFD